MNILSEKPTPRQCVKAFKRGNRDDLADRLSIACLGQMVFIGAHEIAVIRAFPDYRSDFVEMAGQFFIKEWVEFEDDGRRKVLQIVAAGSIKTEGKSRVYGYYLKG